MNIKKIILILMFFSITNCGYEAIYSKKDSVNFSIKNVKLAGNKNINREIVSLLNIKKSDENKNRYNLELNSNKNTTIIAKDKTGKATIYRVTLSVDAILSDDVSTIKKKNFITSFTFNNSQNKFELLQYQKNIEESLINNIAEQITIFITT